MKKLMIALAIAAIAAIGNAASVNWGSGTVLEPGGSTSKKTVTGYLFVLNSTTYNTLLSTWDNGTGEDLSKLIAATYAESLSSAYASKTTTNAGKANLTDDSQDYSSKTAYAAILYTYTSGTDTYYMGNIGTVTVEGTLDVDAVNMASFIGGGSSGTATAWAAVPEPTSGLLLLLGVAGLALKRKRA